MLKKVGSVVGELKRASRELQHQVSEEVRDIERHMDDVKSPTALIRDISGEIQDDFKEDLNDPYVEARRAEKLFQEELASIKDATAAEAKTQDTPPAAKDIIIENKDNNDKGHSS